MLQNTKLKNFFLQRLSFKSGQDKTQSSSNAAFSSSTAPDAAEQSGLIIAGEALGPGGLGSNSNSQSLCDMAPYLTLPSLGFLTCKMAE